MQDLKYFNGQLPVAKSKHIQHWAFILSLYPAMQTPETQVYKYTSLPQNIMT